MRTTMGMRRIAEAGGGSVTPYSPDERYGR